MLKSRGLEQHRAPSFMAQNSVAKTMVLISVAAVVRAVGFVCSVAVRVLWAGGGAVGRP